MTPPGAFLFWLDCLGGLVYNLPMENPTEQISLTYEDAIRISHQRRLEAAQRLVRESLNLSEAELALLGDAHYYSLPWPEAVKAGGDSLMVYLVDKLARGIGL